MHYSITENVNATVTGFSVITFAQTQYKMPSDVVVIVNSVYHQLVTGNLILTTKCSTSVGCITHLF